MFTRLSLSYHIYQAQESLPSICFALHVPTWTRTLFSTQLTWPELCILPHPSLKDQPLSLYFEMLPSVPHRLLCFSQKYLQNIVMHLTLWIITSVRKLLSCSHPPPDSRTLMRERRGVLRLPTQVR